MKKIISLIGCLVFTFFIKGEELLWDHNPPTDKVIKYHAYKALGTAPLSLVGVTTNNRISLGTLAPGNYKFEVIAENPAGLSTPAQILYTVPADEAPPPPPPNFRLSIIDNGNFVQGSNRWTFTGNVHTLPVGNEVCVRFNAGETTPNGLISQTFKTKYGSTYTLYFNPGNISLNKSNQTIRVSVGNTNRTINLAPSPINGTYAWYPQMFDFVAVGNRTTLWFRDLSVTTASTDLMLKNVAVIPK